MLAFPISVRRRLTASAVAVFLLSSCSDEITRVRVNDDDDGPSEEDERDEPRGPRRLDAGQRRDAGRAIQPALHDAGEAASPDEASPPSEGPAPSAAAPTPRADAGTRPQPASLIPLARCPGSFICSSLLPSGADQGATGLPTPTTTAVCLDRAMLPPACPPSQDCGEIGLPGARCISVPVSAGVSFAFSYCEQPCVAAPSTEVNVTAVIDITDAGVPDDDAPRDAGPADAGARDAGRDAGRSIVRSR